MIMTMAIYVAMLGALAKDVQLIDYRKVPNWSGKELVWQCVVVGYNIEEKFDIYAFAPTPTGVKDCQLAGQTLELLIARQKKRQGGPQ